ncbi:hypothetical protein DPSP01_008852 [Paraphaeosphaeria sporulosa]
MSQSPQSQPQTHGANRHPRPVSARGHASSGLRQNANPHTGVSSPNIQSHPQAHRTLATLAQALKRDLASLMHRYHHLRGSEHFTAIDQIHVVNRSQGSTDEHGYLNRLKDILWNQTYPQIQQNGSLCVSDPLAVHSHAQSQPARLSVREPPTQPQRHDSPHREEQSGPHPEPHRRENHRSSRYTASRAPQPAPTHSTPHGARTSHGVIVGLQRNLRTNTRTPVPVPSNTPSYTSTAASEIQGYDKWRPTDERHLPERDEFFKHEVRSKWKRFVLNMKEQKQAVLKGVKFWELE